MLQRFLVPSKVLVNGVVLIGRGQFAQLVEERKVLLGVLGRGWGRG